MYTKSVQPGSGTMNHCLHFRHLYPGVAIIMGMLAFSCGKDSATGVGSNPPQNPGSAQRKTWKLNVALDVWAFNPNAGPVIGDDSLFTTTVDIGELGYYPPTARIDAVYLSDPSGKWFAIKRFSDTATVKEAYTYSILGPANYEGPFFQARFSQLVPGSRPQADSAHLELSW